jgi:Fe-S-cluster containining protein
VREADERADVLEEEEIREDEDAEAVEEEVAELSPEDLARMCGRCGGRCCVYYTVYLDEPEDAEDFDELRWFLCHEGCYLYVDEGQWHLNVRSRCRFLGPEGRCRAYEHRPRVCREFGHEDECEFTGEYQFDRVFRTIPELEAYAREVLAPEELARLVRFPDGYTGPT